MRPISRGRGPEGYSLYLPVTWPASGPSLDVPALLAALHTRTGKGLVFERIDATTNLLLKVSEFSDEGAASAMFDYLNKILAHIAVDSGIALWFYDALEPARTWPIRFPRSWPAGVEAGWLPSDDEDGPGDALFSGGFNVDGVVCLLYPVIIPEHRCLVENGAFSARLVRSVRSGAIDRAVANVPLPGQGAPYARLGSAVRACMNAYSSENPSLRFLSLTTCLELLAQLQPPVSLGSGRDQAISRLIEVVELTLRDADDDDYRAAVNRFKSWARNAVRPSATDMLDRLIRRHAQVIVERLPSDHPARESFEGVPAAIYRLRSKVAHQASLGKYLDEDMHRANQFLQVATTVLMEHALQTPAENGKNVTDLFSSKQLGK